MEIHRRDSFSNVPIELYQKIDELLNGSWLNKLVIRRNPLLLDGDIEQANQYIIEIKTITIWQRIVNFFCCNREQEDLSTRKCLIQMIGEKRFNRILLNHELGLTSFAKTPFSMFTKEILHKIFIGLANIRIEDLQEFYGMELDNKNFFDQTEIDQAFEGLFPYKEIQDIFHRHCQGVSLFDKAKSSGKGFKGLQERIWTVYQARDYFNSSLNENFSLSFSYYEENAFEKRIANAEILSSRFGDREPPPGTVIRLENGYFEVERVFARGGAYITLLSPIEDEISKEKLLVCRGTATRWNATGGLLSGINDLTSEIGFYGITKVWPDLKEYLIQQKIKSLDIYGKSLGGAHAQYLTTLITGLTDIDVRELTTFASVGTPAIVNMIYNSLFEDDNLTKSETKISIIRNFTEDVHDPIQSYENDYIPFIGGNHINNDWRTKLFYVAPKNIPSSHEKILDFTSEYKKEELPITPKNKCEMEIYNNIPLESSSENNCTADPFTSFKHPYSIPEPKDTWDAIKKLFISFGRGHIRQNSLYPEFKVYREDWDNWLDEKNEVSICETLRLKIIQAINCITLGLFHILFNRTTFQDFYFNEKNQFDSEQQNREGEKSNPSIIIKEIRI